MAKLLILVHPGSCCGSADFNLGDDDAVEARDLLIGDLDSWEGGIVVIDGELSSELRQQRYRELGSAIEQALVRAASAGLPAQRIRGDAEEEFDQVEAARSIARQFGLDVGTWSPELTGAWFDWDGGDGCINSVRDALEELGIECAVRSSAASLDQEPASTAAETTAPSLSI